MPITEKAVNFTHCADLLFTNLILHNRKKSRFVHTFDVVIAGAGPSGAYMAYCLAKQGIHPVILDHSYPREKPCRGTISNQTCKQFPLLGAVTDFQNFKSEIQLISPSGAQVFFDKSHTKEYGVISRRHLDRFLLDSAIRCGSKFVNEKVTAIYQENGLWKIKTPERILRARILVGADGVRSIVRKTVLSPFSRHDLALGVGYQTCGSPSKQSLIKFLPHRNGFLWINSHKNHCNTGIFDSLANSSGLKQDLDNFLEREFSGLNPISRWSCLLPRASSPDFFAGPCAGKNWILIGDAAGHVHPLTGEGIPYALWSAEIASQAISAGDLRLYDSLWREEYGKDLVKAISFKKMFFNAKLLNTSVSVARKSESFSRILFAFISGKNTPLKTIKRTLLNMPQILLEAICKTCSNVVFSKFKSH